MEQKIADARGNGKDAQALRSSARVELFSGMILTNVFDSSLTSFPFACFYIVFFIALFQGKCKHLLADFRSPINRNIERSIMWFHNSNYGHKCGLAIPHVREFHKMLTSNDVAMLFRISVKYVLVMFARSLAITRKWQKRPSHLFWLLVNIVRCHLPSEWSPQSADLKSRKCWCLCTCLFHALCSKINHTVFGLIHIPQRRDLHEMLTSKVGSGGVSARVCLTTSSLRCLKLFDDIF